MAAMWWMPLALMALLCLVGAVGLALRWSDLTAFERALTVLVIAGGLIGTIWVSAGYRHEYLDRERELGSLTYLEYYSQWKSKYAKVEAFPQPMGRTLSRMNLRAGPGTEYPRLLQLEKDVVVRLPVVADPADEVPPGEWARPPWFRVAAEGRRGWVHGALIRPVTQDEKLREGVRVGASALRVIFPEESLGGKALGFLMALLIDVVLVLALPIGGTIGIARSLAPAGFLFLKSWIIGSYGPFDLYPFLLPVLAGAVLGDVATERIVRSIRGW